MPTSWVNTLSNSLFLLFLVGIPLYAYVRRIKVYEVFIDGAKEGFQVAIRLIPFLVAMLVAIGMLKASGFFQCLSFVLAPLLKSLHLPVDILPLILIRPFSGGAASGVLASIIQHDGGNAYAAHLGAVIMGSTETTFYVIAVYFGSVSVWRARHAVYVGLFADAVGVIASVLIGQWFWG